MSIGVYGKFFKKVLDKSRLYDIIIAELGEFMKKVQYAGEQMKIDFEPRTRRDVKGYVKMVKEQKTEEEKKHFPPNCVRRGAEISLKKQNEEEKKKMMLDFVKLTLSAKMRIIPERVRFFDDDGWGSVCDLYVKHPSIAGAGQVSYTFTKTQCFYQDWMGNELNYSTAWVDFKKRRENEVESSL